MVLCSRDKIVEKEAASGGPPGPIPNFRPPEHHLVLDLPRCGRHRRTLNSLDPVFERKLYTGSQPAFNIITLILCWDYQVRNYFEGAPEIAGSWLQPAGVVAAWRPQARTPRSSDAMPIRPHVSVSIGAGSGGPPVPPSRGWVTGQDYWGHRSRPVVRSTGLRHRTTVGSQIGQAGAVPVDRFVQLRPPPRCPTVRRLWI